MAVSSTTITSTGAATLVVNTDTDETEDLAVAASAKLQMVLINNTANTTALYLQLFNQSSVGAVTPGTTEPNAVFFCAAGQKINYVIPAELIFSTGIVMLGSTNFAAATYTPAAPASAVTVTLLLGT